jgi:hypothetical protein
MPSRTCHSDPANSRSGPYCMSMKRASEADLTCKLSPPQGGPGSIAVVGHIERNAPRPLATQRSASRRNPNVSKATSVSP